MGTKWTQEQQQVIDLRGCNMLVSAAAGSGKTAVLVERIISLVMDEKKPVDIDRLLVVTFTKAAAAEMRERIRAALESQLDIRPDHTHLQRQMTLIQNAQITTIHSFCLDVIRNYFHLIDLDPGFRIGDEGELRLLRRDVMKQVLEDAYREGGAEYLFFAESFATGKTDQELEDLILQLYEFSMGYPWPIQWRWDCLCAYDIKTPEDFYGSNWMKSFLEKLRLRVSDLIQTIRQALEIAGEPDGPYMYGEALEDDLNRLSSLMHCSDYGEYSSVFSAFGPWMALSRKKDSNVSDEKKTRVKELRDRVKAECKKLQEEYFFADPKQMMEDMRKNLPAVRTLLKLADRFQEEFERQKTEMGILDFNDLEHKALQILVREENGTWTGTAAAAEYADFFEEIMIDEYQDSNLVQEILLSSVSGLAKGRHNLFMVGDVKQSIYRFRLARPELFMEKYHTYKKDEGADRRIDLHRNFRSRYQVLDGVNLIFRQIMTEDLGGVEYDEEAALYPGAQFAEGSREEFLVPEIILSVPEEPEEASPESETDTNEIPPDQRRKEAQTAGLRILELVGKEPVWDRELNAYRLARYSDIALLLRTVSGWADTFAEVLGEMGIPVYTGGSTGYFSTPEIKTVLAYLNILDNPRQDIPLASVLRSPIGGFTDRELSILRSDSPDTDFYTCCMQFLRREPSDRKDEVRRELYVKLERFFRQLGELRALVPYTPMHLLLWKLLDTTGYRNYVTALPGGEQRRANVDMLVEKAVAYEATSYRGLFHFIRYIKQLQKYEIDYGEASLSGENADVVRILSIHKSKGLEFPIVLVCGMGKTFNQQDSRTRLVLHPVLGIGCDYIDPAKRTRWPLMIRRVIGQQIREENLGEELRILYVAMTRAKEKLILIGTVNKPEEQMRRWCLEGRREEEKLSYSCLRSASGYLDWVMPAVLRHESSLELLASYGLPRPPVSPVFCAQGEYRICLAADSVRRSREEVEEERVRKRKSELLQLEPFTVCDEQVRMALDETLRYVYPHDKNRYLPGKLTVSELKKMSRFEEEERGAELVEEPVIVPLIPRFRQDRENAGGAARGTVYHSFMENLDFTAAYDENFSETQLETMIKCGKILKHEAEWISLPKIDRFLSSELASRMRQADLRGLLYREQPFVLGVPASGICPDWDPEEEILVQGIIDAYFIEQEEIVLLDYKTDRVRRAVELTERYQTQLDYYQLALERLTGRKVKEKIIYSFCLDEVIIL